MRCLLSHRRMNSKSGKRISPSQTSQPSCERQLDVTKAEAKEERGKNPCSKQENYKQGRAIAASVFKNMKAISKQKGEMGE
eukprot:2646989-Ditylum_brightwellii.AAC.1